jgi:hypothetical protein
MKEKFRDKLGMNKANIERLETINGIVEEYRQQSFILTLRQLYYQLVSRDVIPNSQKEYAKLSILLTKGRMAGIVDWSAIEDRGRTPKLPFAINGVQEALDVIADQYRINRQAGQENYIEVWVEKDALSNVFARVTEPYHIRLMVNKGYSSSSAMYEAANRFREAYDSNGQDGVLLYFGDHDASGKDMVRDVEERLREMDVESLEVVNPALTMDQVKEYDPPENPAKQTDPRAKWYIEKYGNSSWELDALPPPVLMQIIRDNVVKYMDLDQFQEMRIKEANQKKVITKYASEYIEDDEGFDNDIELDDESDFDFE